MQTVATVRVAIALGIAVFAWATAPADRSTTSWYLIVGLVWLPWASVLLLASDGRSSRFVVASGPIGDLSVLFAAQCLVPSETPVVLLGYAVAVGLATAFWSRRG